MKKIIFLILIFIMLFTFNAFGITEIPLTVYDKAVEVSGVHPFAITNSGTNYRVCYSTDTLLYNEGVDKFISNINGTAALYYYDTTDSGETWSLQQGDSYVQVPLNGTLVYSTIDINNKSAGTVFFSLLQVLPLEENPVVKALNSFVLNVGQQSAVILAVAVVMMALILGVGLIPRVLYRLS